MCRGLDEQVERVSLAAAGGRVSVRVARREDRAGPGARRGRQKALVIAYAVHESGIREVLGLDVGEAETEAFWTEFLFSLKARGLAGRAGCAYPTLTRACSNAIARVLGCRWQRCTVHFIRDMLGHCGALPAADDRDRDPPDLQRRLGQ